MKDTRLILAVDDGALNLDGIPQGVGMRNDQLGEIWLCQGNNPDRIIDPLLAAGAWFGPRRHLEEDTLYRQVIPYVIMRRMGVGTRVEFLIHTRGEHIEEERLRGMVSIGFGGHIDLPDAIMGTGLDTHRLDLFATIKQAADREMREEITGWTHGDIPLISWCGLIRSTENVVSKVHLGVVGVMDVTKDTDFDPNEPALTKFEWKTQEEILAIPFERREGWTDIVARNLHLLG